MKKILLSLVALLATTFSAHAEDWYLVGHNNEWEGIMFTAESEDTWTLDMEELLLPWGFKLLNEPGDWDNQWGAPKGQVLVLGEPMTLEQKAGGPEPDNLKIDGASELKNAHLVVKKVDGAVTLTVTGTVPEGLRWFVCGAFQNWNASAAPEMTYNDATGKYELKVDKLTSGFKIINAQGWGQGEWGAPAGYKLTLDEPLTLTNVGGTDICFDYTAINNAVLSLDADTHDLTVSGSLDMSYPDLYFVGSFEGCVWSLDNAPMFACNEGIYTLDAAALAPYNFPDTGYEFKICGQGWSPQWTNTNDVLTVENNTIYLEKINGGENNNTKSNIAALTSVTFDINTCCLTLESTSTGISSVSTEGAAVYYNLSGTRTATPQHGVVIEMKNGKATKRIF